MIPTRRAALLLSTKRFFSLVVPALWCCSSSTKCLFLQVQAFSVSATSTAASSTCHRYQQENDFFLHTPLQATTTRRTTTTTSTRTSLSASMSSSSSSSPSTKNDASSSADAADDDAVNNVGMKDIGASAKRPDDNNNNNNNNNNDDTTTPTHWRDKIAISIAKSRKIRGGNYVQIATVDPQTLEPRCRTVVFRGFLKRPNSPAKESDAMKMITDARSNKYAEVINNSNNNNNNNNCEMVWWFAKSSEQYRIRGQLYFVNHQEANPVLTEARRQTWGNLSDAAREQFYWPHPGEPVPANANDKEEETQNTVPTGGRDDEGKVLPPPDNFLLMLLLPQRCDYLRLTDNYRQIDTTTTASTENDDVFRAKTWEPQAVTP